MKIIKKIGIISATVIASLTTTSMVFAQDVSPIDPQVGFASDLGVLINGLLTLIMIIASLLVFLYLIWGGIEWITSGGDKGKTESARNKITAAVIGIIVLAASYAVLQLVLHFLNINLNNLLNTLPQIN